MNNQGPKDVRVQKIAWTIRKYSKLEADTRHYSSKVFTVGDCNWKVTVKRETKDGKFFSVALNVADVSKLPLEWRIDAEFTVTVVNQSRRENSERGEVVKHTFSHANGRTWRCPKFMCMKKLEKEKNGFLRNDECIVEVEFYVVKPQGFQPAEHFAYPPPPNEAEKSKKLKLYLKDLETEMEAFMKKAVFIEKFVKMIRKYSENAGEGSEEENHLNFIRDLHISR